MKIRTRLSLQFILLTAGIFTAALFFIYNQFEQHVENEFFTLLESKARMTAQMILRHEEDLRPIAATESGSKLNLPTATNITIYNADTRPVFTLNTVSQQIPSNQLSMIWEKGSCRFFNDGLSAFGTVMQSESGRNYLVISEDKPDYSKLAKLQNILLISFFIAIAAIAAGGWFYAGQALNPVSRIVNEVESILPADLSRRLQSDEQHDELSHLIDTFNQLLDRIEHAFQMQRSFISNVSHELKNPLAAMDAQIQLATNKTRSNEEYMKVFGSLREDVQGMSETAGKLLQLASVYADTDNKIFTRVRLDELLYQTKQQLLKSQPNYVVRIEMNDLPSDEDLLCTDGNEPLLRIALLNLFDNGCKFSPDHSVYVNMVFLETGGTQIRIKNLSGIPESDQKRIFEPFFRSTIHARQKGSGIGLSLVTSILKLHRSKIKLDTDADQETCFVVTFPAFQQSNTLN